MQSLKHYMQVQREFLNFVFGDGIQGPRGHVQYNHMVQSHFWVFIKYDLP